MLPRFYCPDHTLMKKGGALPPEVARHAVRVLRLRVGDALILFDGQGGEYLTSVIQIEGDRVGVAVGVPSAVERESPLSITLIQGLCSTEKMDWILQKAVELGVQHFWVVAMERSMVRLTGERAERRCLHWQKVIVSACEQSGRNHVPDLGYFASLDELLPLLPLGGNQLLLNPAGTKGLADFIPSGKEIFLWVGPEGGLSAAEEARARHAGFVDWRVGPRILRTETAALAVVAGLQMRFGDWHL
ncbi:MAG: 16S rRNA (uracil(1498)-N(3))-methyltransferase [Ferrovum sp.]|nr:16S rRNA (uracil(1498)-N(3))-methyltransferase [Ferrovum sp.]NDU88036.1 16S rRNA (uracil(1498)-N(3))-methyltransferase [Ferrovum sp.]